VLGEENRSNFTTLYPEDKVNSLLKYVEGYPWTVNYYGQLVNDANTLEHVDPGMPALLQPYYHVSGMILQVSSPLSSNYDEASAVTTVTGSGVFPFGIHPNRGDAFIAAVDSGQDAIFVINSVVRKTHRKDSLYDVNYSLYGYVSANQGIVSTLESKVQERYFFNKDSNYFNRDLLITSEVKEARTRLVKYLRDSEQYYFSAFAQKDAGSVYIPGTEGAYYDPRLMEFISKTVSFDVLSQYPFFKYMYRDKYINQSCFFDMLLNRNLAMVSSIHQQQGFVSSAATHNSSRFGSVFHAGVDYILYPKSPDQSKNIDKFIYRDPIDAYATGYKTAKNYSVSALTIQTKNNELLFIKPLLHTLFVDDYYIVSENFYNYVDNKNLYEGISFAELMIYKFLKSEAIALEDLVLLIQSYREWSLLHQFYLLPVIWLIIRNSL
jgi:hypothetical protein